MGFTYEEIPGVIVRDGIGWRCGKCNFWSENWNAVLGHQGGHRTGPRKKPVGKRGNLRGKDPEDMTFREMYSTIDELRTTLAEAERRAKDAESRLNKLRAVFATEIEDSDTDES